MTGLPFGSKESIRKVVENLFDRMSVEFLGDLPKLKEVKRLIVSKQLEFNLPHLFIQGMNNKTPNQIEKGVLKSLIESSSGYMEALKNKTKSNISENIDAIVREAKLNNRKITKKDIENVLSKEFKKAKTHLKTIIESESTKLRNLGTVMDITRRASLNGDLDPTVFFVIVKDGLTCKECLKLHTIDGITPKLWKLSELKQTYHKRGDGVPSSFGLHPHCRCTITYLNRGFGFNKKGKIEFKGENFDDFKNQRQSK